jgi:hypothetical protein
VFAGSAHLDGIRSGKFLWLIPHGARFTPAVFPASGGHVDTVRSYAPSRPGKQPSQ